MWSALALYAAALAFIVLWPVPVDRPAAGFLHTTLQALHRHGVPAWIDYGAVELAANVLLFLPFGLLVGALLPWPRRWLALVLAAALSGAVELAQYLFLDERVGTFQDVLANSLGAALGAAASLALEPRPRSSRRRKGRR
ncbi:VanZ family protein [Arthrobacter sp. GCM10027362]|uniref:VanZ family protein n=1 Tax=Arthrobacter sp. GCM10027362 TaxID=3273379 RepID=UPI00362C7690